MVYKNLRIVIRISLNNNLYKLADGLTCSHLFFKDAGVTMSASSKICYNELWEKKQRTVKV